jgi:hypothetical protein
MGFFPKNISHSDGLMERLSPRQFFAEYFFHVPDLFA